MGLTAEVGWRLPRRAGNDEGFGDYCLRQWGRFAQFLCPFFPQKRTKKLPAGILIDPPKA